MLENSCLYVALLRRYMYLNRSSLSYILPRSFFFLALATGKPVGVLYSKKMAEVECVYL